jgi:hypothetical protein
LHDQKGPPPHGAAVGLFHSPVELKPPSQRPVASRVSTSTNVGSSTLWASFSPRQDSHRLAERGEHSARVAVVDHVARGI